MCTVTHGIRLHRPQPSHAAPLTDPAAAAPLQIRMYNFAAQGYSPSTGHFTQMVWRSTQRIGCGVQPRCSGGNFLVCHYDPPGGWPGAAAMHAVMMLICVLNY